MQSQSSQAFIQSSNHTSHTNTIKKLWLLLWKNYMLQKRHLLSVFIELFLPLLLSVLLMSIRVATLPEKISKPQYYEAVDVTDLPINAIPVVRSKMFPIVFSPNSPVINEVVDSVAEAFQINIRKFGFATEEDLENYIENNKDIDFLAGLSFENMESNYFGRKIKYKIRLKTKVRANSNNPMIHAEGWMTQQMFPMFPRPGPRSENEFGPSPYYYEEGFLSIQHAVSNAILEIQKKHSEKTDFPLTPKLKMKLFPTPPYSKDEFIVALQTWLPVIIMLSFLYSSINIIKLLVQEKEHRIKEAMKMMGLSGFLHWTAWYIKSLVILILSVVMMTLLLTLRVYDGVGVITYTSLSLLFVFLLLYVCSTLAFCFAVSTFFSRASSAVTAAGLIYFFSYVPYMYIHPRYLLLSWEMKMAFCILPNTAMAFGGQFITMFEGAGSGLDWENFHKGATPDDNLSMFWIFIMLVVDFIFYLLLTWYVDTVYPGEFGVPKPWYFPITKSYWCGTVPISEVVAAIEETRDASLSDILRFEKDPKKLPAGIQIKRLTKVFGKKVVVNNISLNIYRGQITVLLGHNGAGKTTTMSMLTGLIPPTKGTAFVHGYDITTDMKGVRNSLGLCPQYDVLFDELTVKEHLHFFYKLKNGIKKFRKTEINHVIKILKMGNMKNVRVSQLSRGLKRKLSVGIAFIGGSKVVLLDEPTSGMDPAARRDTWDMLQSECAGRTILVTTHFMDEADILGDRVAIMANGEIKCCGSPLFLKKLYGRGYQLVIIKQPDCDIRHLTLTLRVFVTQAILSRVNGAELTYILPYKDLPSFSALFEHLETNKELLSIAGFGISMTTMEEVFFRVGEESGSKYRMSIRTAESDQNSSITSYDEFILNDAFEYDTTFRTVPSSSLYNLEMKTTNRGLYLIFQQFWALLIKRITHTRRNFGLMFLQLVIPLIFVSIALVLAKMAPKAENELPVELTLQLFSETVIPFTIVGPVEINSPILKSKEKLAEFYTNQIMGKNHLKFLGNSEHLNKIDEYILKKASEEPMLIKHQYIVGATINNVSGEPQIIAHFNDEPYHSAPISLNLVENALFRYVLNDQDYHLIVVNHPLPTTKMTETYQGQATSIGFDVAFNLVFGAAILASSFVIFLIKERETNAKHLQFVSGVNFICFWIATFMWDFINYMVPCLCIMLMFEIFRQEEFIEREMQARFLLVFVVYGWSILPLMYVLSFCFEESSTGFTNLTIFNAFTGMGTFVTTIMLYLPKLNMRHIADTLQWAFLPLPNYCLAWAFFNLYKNYVAYESCSSDMAKQMCTSGKTHPCCKETGNCGPDGCLNYTSDYLDWEFPGIGRMLFFMYIVGGFFSFLLLLIELRLPYYIEVMKTNLRRLKSGRKSETPFERIEEEDVARERHRIENTPIELLIDDNIVIMKKLTKYYGKVLAVNNLSIGIQRKECFGLLGTTGAGKTTIFKMLTGDTVISKGDAYLEGYSASKEIKKVRKMIGYCPQFDAVIDQMTGRETLKMYARLRGVPERKIPDLVEALATNLMFKEHINKQAKTYSGGNRRKLSTAVAMIGNPPIVFLDEPTTGVDPVSRRMLWDSLCRLRDSGCSITLTTHSMEECEALCTRLAIMVQGSFVCLGSPQHLKNKFGQAYTLIVKVEQLSFQGDDPSRTRSRSDNLTRLCKFIEDTFTGSELKEIHQGMAHYIIKNPTLSLATIFSTMENIKEEFLVEDYSVSQTTLEDVFLNFVKEAEEKGTTAVLTSLSPLSIPVRSSAPLSVNAEYLPSQLSAPMITSESTKSESSYKSVSSLDKS